MKISEYKRMTEAKLKGRRAITLMDISSRGGAIIPKGATVTIVGKQAGLRIRTDKCPTCGCQFEIWKVSPTDIEFIPLLEAE